MQTVNLYQWLLYGHDGKLRLQGICDYHKNLGRFTFIDYTTSIQSAKVEDGKLIAETRNTRYVCKLTSNRIYPSYMYVFYEKMGEEIDSFRENYSEDVIAILESEIEKYKEIVAKSNSKDGLAHTFFQVEEDEELSELIAEYKSKLINIIKDANNTIYIDMDTIKSSLMAYNINGKTGVVRPHLHSGMFQDSVLYMEPGVIDFRYFPNGSGETFETYSWSNNIEHALIKNSMDHDITFNKQLIKPDEIVELDRENHRHGLISPSVV